jgi:hypothetical protein
MVNSARRPLSLRLGFFTQGWLRICLIRLFRLEIDFLVRGGLAVTARTQIFVALGVGLVCLGLFYMLAEQNVLLSSPVWRVPKLLFVVIVGWILHALILVGYLVWTDQSDDGYLVKIKRYAAIYPSESWWEVVRECERRARPKV